MCASLSIHLFMILIIIRQFGYISTEYLSEETLNSIGLATKYGHPPTQYDVVTEDGYILALYRLPGKGSIPILLTHGIFDSSDTWLIRGDTSLAITLANKGHDVWLANIRGNRYSRRHQHLNPDTDPEFWNFSFHEIGCYDLPAIIDFILNETGAKKLTAIGHSMGNTIYYVLGSERPEYNSKINVMMALSPVAYLHNTLPPVSTIISLYPIIKAVVIKLGKHEVVGDSTTLGRLFHSFCSIPVVGNSPCVNLLFFPFFGFDNTELEPPSFFSDLATRFPAGSSSMTPLHFLQVGNRKTFARYDYGSEINQKIYNSSEPPEYQLGRVTMPVTLLAAANDRLSSLADVQILRDKLPNVVYYLLNPRALCNHADYVWGRTANEYLYPYIDLVLERYNPLKMLMNDVMASKFYTFSLTPTTVGILNPPLLS